MTTDRIDLDGAAGEGGGQILRSALALSLVTRRPFRLARVRAGRRKPGLLRQHLAAVQAATAVGRAAVTGATLGSQELTFAPTGCHGGDYAFAVGGAYGAQLALQARLSNWQKQATVHVLVQNGVIVEPLVTRQVPVFSRSLTQGGITRMRPVQEAVIAVEPDEVARLTEAMAVDARVSTAALSRLWRWPSTPESRQCRGRGNPAIRRIP